MKLEVQNGSFAYNAHKRLVLDKISFSIEKGDIMAILGPNGAGKTTLLRCVTGLLKWNFGVTLLDGQKLSTISRKKLWQKVSYVPQTKQSFAAYTVEEMILLGRAPYVKEFSVPKGSDMDAVDRCIYKTGIGHLRKRLCSELSGGELQMVMIARALVSDPEILILDEPESNLDFRNQLLVLDMISSLAADGIGCIFNTHYPAHAIRRAKTALMLGKDGSYNFGPTEKVVTEENILRFFKVRAVIGQINSDGATYPDVVPISIEKGSFADELS